MRPYQWVKNGFVLAPLLFGRRLLEIPTTLRALAAFGVFCLASSAVYVFNDLRDVEEDRLHPTKRRRPIASGALPVPHARALAAGLAAVALGTSFALSLPFGVAVVVFLLLNLAYTLGLKRIVFLDVLAIAAGFILRVAGGALVVEVNMSGWLLLCTLLLATFLGLGKRKHELISSGSTAKQQRPVLASYRRESLDIILALTATATMTAYIFYTMSDHAAATFASNHLHLTIPGIMLGILRFLQLVDRRKQATSPTDAMLRDPLFVINFLVWAALVVLHLYLPMT